ncbi:MAG TPA: hypothetical protein PKC87_03735, partial [Candidatus Absconditabacterales bacterium]|nr:hypothetical protein [Candidatus Absconditabacterales bacterium]
MAKTKNILTRGLVVIIGMIGAVQGAKVNFQPLYSDIRFQPTDKLHAGCNSSADILFSPQGQKITKFTLVLYYNPENIEILRILPTVNNATSSSKIEYNKIILEVENPIFSSSTQTVSFFQLYFKSDMVGNESLILGTGSEYISANKTYPLSATFPLQFGQVPECDPDIVPPSINLIYPKDSQQNIQLDQYFIFDVKDIGKGVDKNSVVIRFDGEKYVYGTDNLKWNGNYLTFYPSKWIPIDSNMELKISLADKQSYGGANKTESTYSFQTATGIVFNKNVTPTMFRRITQEAGKISASVDECSLLSDFYSTSEVNYQRELKSIIQKVGCDLAPLDT